MGCSSNFGGDYLMHPIESTKRKCNDPAFSAHIMPLKRMPGQGFSSSTPDVGADDCKR